VSRWCGGGAHAARITEALIHQAIAGVILGLTQALGVELQTHHKRFDGVIKRFDQTVVGPGHGLEATR
jgi:hypothetical protein